MLELFQKQAWKEFGFAAKFRIYTSIYQIMLEPKVLLVVVFI